MKLFYTSLIILLICHFSNAQVTMSKDTSTKTGTHKIVTSVEFVPEFPGGIPAFYNYIGKNLKYPEVARLIGINGKVLVSFVVNRDGTIGDVIPKSCLGAGCEAEAVKVIEMSPTWKPGIQNGKPVRVAYTVPISFDIPGTEKTSIRSLRQSNYGFVFSIKDTLYTIDEAQKILGKEFDPAQIKAAEPFYNYDKNPKYDMPDKKEVYLLIFKST